MLKGNDANQLDPSDPKAIIANASTNMDDEYEQRKGSDKNYYSIAHTLREPVYDQPSMMVNGRLKEYQVGMASVWGWVVVCTNWTILKQPINAHPVG